MKSLQYLNGVSDTVVVFSDTRPANVLFDRPVPKDTSFTLTDYTFSLTVGGNIVEIIQPAITNVRYKINLGSADAVVNWGTLPPGVTTTQTGTIHTLYGINSVETWELIKQPTIIVNPSYTGTFSYSAAVVYNTSSAADIEYEWNVGVYAPLSELIAQASIDIAPNYIRGATSNPQAYFSLGAEGRLILGSSFTMNVNARADKVLQPLTLTVQPTLDCTAIRYIDFADSTSIDPAFGELYKGITIDVDSNILITSTSNISNTMARLYNLPTGTLNETIYESGFTSDTTKSIAYKNAGYTLGNYYPHQFLAYIDNSGTAQLKVKYGSNDWSGSNTITACDEIDIANYGYIAKTKIGNTVSVFKYIHATTSLNSEWSIGISGDLGTYLRMNDDYVVIAGRNTSRQVNVYNTLDGTLIYTITLGTTILGIDLKDNVIAVATDSGVDLYDIISETNTLTIPQTISTQATDQRVVSLTDLYVSISSTNEYFNSNTNRGVVRIYQRATGNIHATLYNPNVVNNDPNDQFGSSVYVSEDYCIVGAPYEDNASETVQNVGVIYIYS